MTLADTSHAELAATAMLTGFRCPPCERLRLPSGFEVWTTVDHTVPMIHLLCAVPMGALHDPAGKEGLSALVLMLLREGTIHRSATEITEQAEERGADVITRLGWEASSVAIELLESDFEFGLELLAELLWSPSFPRQSVELGIQRQLGRLKQRHWNPANLADLWLAQMVFGETRYGRSLLGCDASLRQIQRDDLLACHRRHLGLNATVLVAVGSFDRQTLIQKLEPLLSAGWQAHPMAGAEASETEPLCAPPASCPVVVDLPAARRTELRVGLAVNTNDPLGLAGLEVLASILRWRLGLKLRDRHAATYSITSRFEARRGSAPFFVSVAVDNRQVGAALHEVIGEIIHLRDEAPAEHEILEIRYELTGALLRSFQSIDGWATRLQELAVNRRPADYFYLYMESLHRLQPEDLRRLAALHLDPERLTIVAAGPAKEIRHQLAPWGMPVEVDAAVEPRSFESKCEKRGNATC